MKYVIEIEVKETTTADELFLDLEEAIQEQGVMDGSPLLGAEILEVHECNGG